MILIPVQQELYLPVFPFLGRLEEKGLLPCLVVLKTQLLFAYNRLVKLHFQPVRYAGIFMIHNTDYNLSLFSNRQIRWIIVCHPAFTEDIEFCELLALLWRHYHIDGHDYCKEDCDNEDDR
jgi:hypothetical protein